MYGACQTWADVAANKVNCVWGALTSSATACMVVMSAHNLVGHISTYMTNNAVSIGGFGKRETIPQGLLDEFAIMFGVDPVSHHGVWHYTPPVANGTLHRRQQSIARDVFTYNKNGMDHHFAYLGNQTTTGSPMFRIGYGPPKTNTNTTLKIRGRNTSGESFGDQYFTSGGIDFKVDVNPDNLSYPDGGIDTATDYDWFYDQIACIMSDITPSGQDYMASQGMFFQVYDNSRGGTMASLAVAPFDSGPSAYTIIEEMDIEGGLLVNNVCVNMGYYDTTT
jgi:hypothetical protein